MSLQLLARCPPLALLAPRPATRGCEAHAHDRLRIARGFRSHRPASPGAARPPHNAERASHLMPAFGLAGFPG